MLFFIQSDDTERNRSLVIAAAVLGLVHSRDCKVQPGGCLIFEVTREPDKYLLRIASVIRPDGRFNGKSPHAERYAVCLMVAGATAEAFALFSAIVEGEEEFLFQGASPHMVPVADTPGKLGYEGMYRFGELALSVGQTDLAKRIFLEIVCKTPTKCYPIRLQDVRVLSLKKLISLGCETLPSGVSLSDELTAARDHQY